MLNSTYSNSHALVIGINAYAAASPLGYAVSDAAAVAAALKERFRFPEENVYMLLDGAATRAAILERFLSFACGGTGPNDRVVLFYAGHGHTVRSARGEVGYLVPSDGDPQNLASLIRWDELTRNADLIDAKHLLFVMDACYGGLAITRALKPGSMRFLKDMLLRPARQVLSAGKGDELVADLGGPRPDHSVFTGHLLEALDGKAADKHGVVTANGVMAYVYQSVSSDPDSQQTPHFGYLGGDGDLIFHADILIEPSAGDERKDEDTLVAVPAVLGTVDPEAEMTTVEQAKELLSEERHKLKLYDMVTRVTREVLSATSEDHFAVQASWVPEEFFDRLRRYEATTAELLGIQALLGFWGEPWTESVLTLGPRRLLDRLQSVGGLKMWIALRWYPELLLLYNTGIAAVASGKYSNLREAMLVTVPEITRVHGEGATLVRAVTAQMKELQDAFKFLPGHEKQYVPRSEYLFKLLQPQLDELLFLGSDYETHFDRFEILYALEHAYQLSEEYQGRYWGPVGRFGWKFGRGAHGSPYHMLVAEAEREGASWPPVRAGLFGGSIDRFKEVASKYQQEVLSKLHWF